MTAWGWAASAPVRSTEASESARRRPPMAVAPGVDRAEALAQARVPVVDAEAVSAVVVVSVEAASEARAAAAADWDKTPMDEDRADALDVVLTMDNSPASATGG